MLPWLFEAARPETTFCASYACPDLRKLISDTVSTAGGTDICPGMARPQGRNNEMLNLNSTPASERAGR
jgi:hypothetical protein